MFDAKFLFSGFTYEVLCWVVILADAAFFTSAGFRCMLNNGGDGCCGYSSWRDFLMVVELAASIYIN